MKITTSGAITTALYLAITLLWGSTWLAIQYQVHTVPPVWSIVYRFVIASTVMLGYCLLTRTKLQFNRREHGWMFLQGILLTSLNYYFYYSSSQYLLSGLTALVFANIVIINIFTSRLFLGHRITKQIVLGILLGISGLCFVFWSEIGHMHNAKLLYFSRDMLKGITLCLLGTFCASLGTITAAHNRAQRLPILQTNTISMVYGTLCTTVLALFSPQVPQLDLSVAYVTSLLYLAIPGTVIALLIYVALVGRIGPNRSGYVFVTTPIVALTLSTAFEEFHWTSVTLLGVILALIGNLLVMLKPSQTRTVAAHIAPSSANVDQATLGL